MTAPQSPYQSHIKELKDYYWAYADILRDIGINESTYDQRIMAFMALKLLIDNDKLRFNFEYRDNFSLSEKEYKSPNCDRCEINIGQEIGFKDDMEELSIDALIGELDVLMKDMCDDYQTNGLLGLK